MASTSFTTALCFFSQNPIKNLEFSSPILFSITNGVEFASNSIALTSSAGLSPATSRFSSRFARNCSSSTTPVRTLDYEFTDGSSEVELRLQLGTQEIRSSKDIFVDANETSLTIRVQRTGSIITLLETKQLFEKIKPSETIWYIDEDQLVINLKKHDSDLKWPDIVESWESLTAGSTQLLKGTSIYLIGDSTDINQKVAHELAVGLGYTPLSTKELLETFSKQTIDSWMLAEGSNAVAQAETAVLESLSSHVRAVVATLGGEQGAAGRTDAWRHLYAGFTVWLSQTEAKDESAAKEEARRHMQDSKVAYSNAEVVVKLQGWDDAHSKAVAQAALSALKQLTLSDKNLPEKSLHPIGMSR
ncbi:probable inactive shikimate kinase like 2, chloroplastic isoform X2 [Momordica charantia]|uniref:Probable inactive shikimate kinase like 2, chloroplastic isoform X2 n=1 Tax=Momordica charantia TaxID=3673 RepID=A0A6J1CUQ8_MOMCH|nr:probable inactive shikimate kinase like 2, chloroplastic isoform X2 [Momordica charantia]